MSAELNAEEALDAYVSMLAVVPLPTVVLDLDGHVRLWNDAAESILGWTAAEVVGLPPPGVPEDLAAQSQSQVDRALAGETIADIETRRLTKSGQILDVRVAVAPLRREDGEIVGVVRVFEDVSNRKQMEESLQQSEERFRTIVSTAFEGIWLIDASARTVYANERMAQMLGCSPAYLLDRSVNDFVYPEDETGHIAHLQKNLQGHVEQF